MECTDSGDVPVGRRALAKASGHLLPLLFLGYGIAYMDRVNVGFAALRMNQDLHFSASVYGLAGWQWLFLLQGLPAIVLGVLILALLRDQPAQASWLSATERSWLESRLEAERSWLSAQAQAPLFQVASDAHLWRLCLCNVMVMGSGYSLSTSAPLLLRSAVHWDAVRIGALVSGTGILSALAMLVNGRLSDRSHERHVHAALPMGICAVAALAMGLWPTGPMIVAGYVICTVMLWTTQAVFWLIPTDVMQGRSAAVGLAAIGSIGMLDAFAGPYGWGLAKDLTGGYQVGLVGLAVAYATALTLLMSLRRSSRAAAPVTTAA